MGSLKVRKYRKYKITIGVLSAIIILETLLIIVITRPKKIVKVRPVIKAKIAIVIDDWGYNTNNLYLAGQLNYPLTAAVLPHLSFSVAVAKELHKNGFEIILHLPMEPHEKYRLEQNTIMVSMDEATIRNIINRDLMDLPYTRGVSNHMGSRVTEDRQVMKIILKELKRKRLYFLDSIVSSRSIASVIAGEMNLRYARRDVFLDNVENAEYIKGQIYKLKNKARLYGQAIGIGHDQKVTLEVLKEVMPQLEREGYKFVYVSELVR